MGTAQNQYISGAPPGSPFHLLYHAKFKDNPASEVRSQEEALEKLKASPDAAVYLTVAPEFFTQKGLDSYSLKIPEVKNPSYFIPLPIPYFSDCYKRCTRPLWATACRRGARLLLLLTR